MILHIGDMWSAYPLANLFLFTANSFVTKKGKLVMGRGMAKQVRDTIPGIDEDLGGLIPHLGTYGLMESRIATGVGAFQVKKHFRKKAELDLIRVSTDMLQEWLVLNPEAQVHLNFPGIGNGRLKEIEVLPIIEELPDTVHVWKYQ